MFKGRLVSSQFILPHDNNFQITVQTLSYKIPAYEKMAYTVVQSCPLTFREWSSRASSTCSSGTYHCVEDEYSRRVEVCVEPKWIEPGISYKIFIFLKVLHNQI